MAYCPTCHLLIVVKVRPGQVGGGQGRHAACQVVVPHVQVGQVRGQRGQGAAQLVVGHVKQEQARGEGWKEGEGG